MLIFTFYCYRVIIIMMIIILIVIVDLCFDYLHYYYCYYYYCQKHQQQLYNHITMIMKLDCWYHFFILLLICIRRNVLPLRIRTHMHTHAYTHTRKRPHIRAHEGPLFTCVSMPERLHLYNTAKYYIARNNRHNKT